MQKIYIYQRRLKVYYFEVKWYSKIKFVKSGKKNTDTETI